LVTGLSGNANSVGNIQISGMSLACVVGILLSLTFHILDKCRLTNDVEEA
jgi:uracil permease